VVVTRDEVAASLPVARNVLTARLRTLVEHGVLERVPYQERPVRYEYRLTSKGAELYPVILGLLQWGDRHLAGTSGPPVVLAHAECGAHPASMVVCEGCGETLTPRDVRRSDGARRRVRATARRTSTRT